ncbi:Polynucleotidyl transferase- ribonuclease H-like superfamily protein, partial [Striga hermonthica]
MEVASAILGTGSAFFPFDLHEWLRVNLTNTSPESVKGWARTFGVTVWRLWSDRNAAIFTASSFSISDTVREVGQMVDNIQMAALVEHRLGGVGVGRHVRWVAWTAPPMGVVKVNTDDSLLRTFGMASAEGL